MDKKNRLITDLDSMKTFRANSPNIFIVEDSTLLENGKYHYKGEIDLNFGLSYMNITILLGEHLKIVI